MAANTQTAALISARRLYMRWELIFWLFVISAVAFLDRINISIAGSSLAAAYHLSNVQLGVGLRAFSAVHEGPALM